MAGMHPDARTLIERFALKPHPEGGFYSETYRSPDRVISSSGSERVALTSIYFLLTAEAFSAFHRIASDEAWHYYLGTPLTLELIDPVGRHEQRTLSASGPWQTVVPARTHFAAHVEPDGWAFVGCDVAPGFEFADFQLTTRSMLTAAYPHLAALIARYTR